MKIIENTQFNRINLQFDEKPSKEILQKLKDEGWRYSPQHKLWYPFASAVENSRAFAESLQKDINNEASAYMESMQEAIDTNEPGFSSADERLSALVQNATDYAISPENTKLMVESIKQEVIKENDSILEARLIQMEKILLDMKTELQTTRERISKLENNNINNNKITFPVVVLPQSSDFVESWSNNHNSVAKGLFLIKEDDKLVAIDNRDGECWVEDFDSLDKAVTYLTNSTLSVDEIRELNEADAHAAALNKLTEADLVLINDNILNSNVFVTADIGNPVELALHNPKTGEYFLIQSIDDDDRWDYTLYDKDFKLIDGGQGVSGDISMPEDIRTAAQVVLKEFHPDDLSINDWVIRDYSDLSELINEIEAANYERVVDSIQQNWTDHDNGVEQARDERDSREMNAELSRLDAEAEAMERANGLREMENSAISLNKGEELSWDEIGNLFKDKPMRNTLKGFQEEALSEYSISDIDELKDDVIHRMLEDTLVLGKYSNKESMSDTQLDDLHEILSKLSDEVLNKNITTFVNIQVKMNEYLSKSEIYKSFTPEHSKEEFNGFWIPQHNAVVMKKGLEENKAPFLPNAAGIIKAEAIYNANSGYCLPAGRLIPVQFAKMEMGYKSDIVFPRTTIIASGSSFKENEKGVLFNFKDEQGEVHTSSLFFPEQTQNPDILIDEYKNKIVKANNLSDISMVIASSEPREYLGTYIAACRSGMKLSVDPQIAEEFKTKIMPVLENDIRDRGTRDKTMPTLSNILFDAEKRGTDIVRTLSAENHNVVLSKAEQEIRDAQIKLNNIVTETFLTLTDEEKENGTTLENKTIRYEKWYKPMVDEIMADIANGNKEALTIIQNFDLDPETHVQGNKWYTAIEAFNRDVQYKLLPELYEKVQDRIKAEYEEKKIPYVVMFSSESPKFPSENKVYTVTEFNEILMQADSEFHNRKKYAEQKYGSADNYWDLERDDKLPEEDKGIQFGYDKTNFKFFNIPNPRNPEDTFSYEPSRYDIGDGNGSIFDYVRATCSHDEFIEALNALETQLYFPNLDNNHKQIIDNFVSEEKRVLSEKVQEAMKELDEAQSEYKELHKKWLIEASEADRVDNKLKAAVDNIHQVYEDSVNNIYDNVFENIPPTDRSLSLETSTTLRYMSNEAKKLCIESLYQPSRDAQKAMNAEDYKTYNSVDWAKLRRIWEQFPANVNMSNWTNTLLEGKIKDLGIELESQVEKTPAQSVTEEERESNINAAKAVRAENARKQYEAELGSNYDSNLSTTDIARNLRNYIKQNHPGYKFSVTSQYFSGGSSISVKLKETPVEITNFELMKAYVEQNDDSNNNRIWDSETRKYTYYSELSEDKKKEFIEQEVRNAHMKNISEYSDDRSLAWMNEDVRKVYQDVIQHLESYNYDHSDSQSDYFSVNFYSNYGITKEAVENSHKHNVQKVRVNNESVSVPVEFVEINTDVNQRLDAIINSFKESDLVLNVRKNDDKINVSIHEPESGNMIFTLNQTGNPVIPVLSNDLSMNEYEELKQLATEYFEIITENQTAPEYLENQFAKDIKTKTPVQLEIISNASGILNDFALNYDLLYQNDGVDRIQDIEQNIALKFDEAMRANGEFASIVRDLASIREDAFTSDRECAALFISLENAGYLNKITETKDVVIEDVYKLINENNDKELTQEDLDICKKVVPKQQLAFTLELTKGEEGEFFTNKLKQIADTYRKINTNKELINEDGTHNVGFRYFLGDTEIFLSEIDSDGIGFGYNILNGDLQMSEWGSTSLEEILSIPYMEMDYHVPDNATIEQMLYQEHPEYFSEYAPKEELKQEVQAEGKNLSAIVHPEVSYFVASNIEFEEELFSGLSLEEALAKYEELMSEDHSGYIPCIGIDTKDGSMYDSGPEGHGQVIYAGKIIEDVLKDIKYFKKMPEYVDAMKKLTEALMANGYTVENGNEFLESHKDIIEVNGIKYNSYYNSLKTREICHNIAGDDLDKRNEAVKTMADWFINQNVIGPDDILIPAPQHTGNAEYTKEIAELVSKATGAEIADILKCEPHEPLYEQKQAATPDLDPKLYVEGTIPDGKRLVLIDNVISTGVTFNEANKLIPGITPMVYAITDNANLRYQYEQYYAGTLKRQNYTIYQLKHNPDLHDISFASSKELKSMGKEIDFNNYEMVYSGHIDITHSMRNVNVTSEKIFEQLNNNRPDDYKAHSLSTSDIIVLEKEDGSKQAMFVDDIGFLHNTPELLQFVERMNERIGPDSSISWNELEKFFDGHIKSQLASFETTKQEVIEERYDNEIQEKDETVGRMLMDNLDWHYFSDDGIDEENELSGKILEEKWSMIEDLEVRIVDGKVKTFEEAQIIINDQLLHSDLYHQVSVSKQKEENQDIKIVDEKNDAVRYDDKVKELEEQGFSLKEYGLVEYNNFNGPQYSVFSNGQKEITLRYRMEKVDGEQDTWKAGVIYETSEIDIEPVKPLQVYTFSPFGYEGTVVQVETDLRPGIPAFDIVGLADSAVKETRERIQAAFRNSGLEFPAERVLQSLSPADLRKDAPMDLSMALGILGQTNKYPVTEPVLALGELELSGGIRPVRGAVAAVNTAKAAGIKNVVCDPTTAELLKNIDGIKILTAENLKEANEKLMDTESWNKKFSIEVEQRRQREFVREKTRNTDLWMKTPTGDESLLREQLWLDIQTPNFKRNFGNWNYDENQKVNIISLDTTDLPFDYENIQSLKQWLKTNLVGKSVEIDSDGQNVKFNSRTTRASIKRRGEEQRGAYSVLDDLIENSVYFDFEKTDNQNKHNHLKGQDVYYSALKVGEKLYSVRIKIDVSKDNLEGAYKDHKVAEINIAPNLYHSQSNDLYADIGANVISMAVLTDFVKPQNLMTLNALGEPSLEEIQDKIKSKNVISDGFTDKEKELFTSIFDVESTPTVQFNDEWMEDYKEALENLPVDGHFETIRAIEIAVAGKHNIIATGAPGCGKTLLTQTLMPALTPKLTEDEAKQITRINSLAGLDSPKRDNLIPPFRMPHQTATIEGMCGGGPNCRPGEISLAHQGTLFLDETAEFRSSVIQILRVPLESRSITLSRAGRSTTYPADFQLAMAMNPCPCGCYGSHDKLCLDSARSIEMYWKKVSDPLLDRVEIKTFVQKDEKDTRKISIEEMKAQIATAFEIQRKRGVYNSHMTPEDIQKYCKLDNESQAYLDKEEDKLTPRGKSNLLKLSLTIANMAGREEIHINDIKEARELSAPVFEKPRQFVYDPEEQKKATVPQLDDVSITPEQIKEAENERKRITEPVLNGERTEMYTSFKDFEDKGVFEINGTHLNVSKNGGLTPTGWKQLQAAMEIYRSKKFETFRYIIINEKTGEIADQLAITSHMPNFCNVSKPNDETLKQVISRLEELGDDYKLAVCHNHPSGNTTESSFDRELTDSLDRSLRRSDGMNKFLGHIILDHDTFNLAVPSQNNPGKCHWKKMEPQIVNEVDRFTADPKPEWAGDYVGGTSALKAVAVKINDTENWNDDFIPVVFTNADRSITGVQYYSKNFFENESSQIRNEFQFAAMEAGAIGAFPVITDALWNKLGKESNDFEAVMKAHVLNDAFTDVAFNHTTMTEKYDIEAGRNYYSFYRDQSDRKIDVVSTWTPSINTRLFPPELEKKKEQEIER